ncbi:hypothetical protein M231_06677 [Tremella mesenterica]|uniref:Uncharacterized protein n=1 Tax=Tremella mesenterica TaxID=5217 RepID=A0A4Q1BB51_TREME|nr:hypothetical protein M231_06677 [Tremella mesenterica]
MFSTIQEGFGLLKEVEESSNDDNYPGEGDISQDGVCVDNEEIPDKFEVQRIQFLSELQPQGGIHQATLGYFPYTYVLISANSDTDYSEWPEPNSPRECSEEIRTFSGRVERNNNVDETIIHLIDTFERDPAGIMYLEESVFHVTGDPYVTGDHPNYIITMSQYQVSKIETYPNTDTVSREQLLKGKELVDIDYEDKDESIPPFKIHNIYVNQDLSRYC